MSDSRSRNEVRARNRASGDSREAGAVANPIAACAPVPTLLAASVALAFGVLQLAGSDAGTLSVVLASQMVPLVVFMLIGGVIADR